MEMRLDKLLYVSIFIWVVYYPTFVGLEVREEGLRMAGTTLWFIIVFIGSLALIIEKPEITMFKRIIAAYRKRKEEKKRAEEVYDQIIFNLDRAIGKAEPGTEVMRELLRQKEYLKR